MAGRVRAQKRARAKSDAHTRFFFCGERGIRLLGGSGPPPAQHIMIVMLAIRQGVVLFLQKDEQKVNNSPEQKRGSIIRQIKTDVRRSSYFAVHAVEPNPLGFHSTIIWALVLSVYALTIAWSRLSRLTLLEPQSRFRDKPLESWEACPQHGTDCASKNKILPSPRTQLAKGAHCKSKWQQNKKFDSGWTDFSIERTFPE